MDTKSSGRFCCPAVDFCLPSRLWAFLDHDPTYGSESTSYFQAWNQGVPSINNGANGIPLLDNVVAQAEANDIKLIFTLVKWVVRLLELLKLIALATGPISVGWTHTSTTPSDWVSLMISSTPIRRSPPTT